MTVPAGSMIDVLIVDDSADLAAMLSTMLSLEPDLRVVGTLSQADDLAVEVVARRPHVVLLDLTMPGKPPIDALREVKALSGGPPPSVLVYSGYDDQRAVLAARDAGADGFISKSADPASVAKSVRAAAQPLV